MSDHLEKFTESFEYATKTGGFHGPANDAFRPAGPATGSSPLA